MQNVKILPHLLSKYKKTTGFNWGVLYNTSHKLRKISCQIHCATDGSTSYYKLHEHIPA